MTTFNHDELVDVVIRGALVDIHGDYSLTVTIPGCDMQVEIPLLDDKGGALALVKVSRAEVFTAAPVPIMWSTPLADEPRVSPSVIRPGEAVEAAHMAGNHGWCNHSCAKPGCTIDHTQLIPLDGNDELLGGVR